MNDLKIKGVITISPDLLADRAACCDVIGREVYEQLALNIARGTGEAVVVNVSPLPGNWLSLVDR
jgi:hypothetical protein